MSLINSKKYNIILDVDNTLLESIDINSISTDKLDKLTDLSDNFIVFENGKFLTFFRNYLIPFLVFLFDNFNVSIWTAGSANYVLPIISEIYRLLKKEGYTVDKGYVFDFILTGEHCDIVKQLNYPCLKDLKWLWTNPQLSDDYMVKNTLLIDDNTELLKNYPSNVIIAEYFNVSEKNSDKDNFLVRLQSLLEETLIRDPTIDVRFMLMPYNL